MTALFIILTKANVARVASMCGFTMQVQPAARAGLSRQVAKSGVELASCGAAMDDQSGRGGQGRAGGVGRSQAANVG